MYTKTQTYIKKIPQTHRRKANHSLSMPINDSFIETLKCIVLPVISNQFKTVFSEREPGLRYVTVRVKCLANS